MFFICGLRLFIHLIFFFFIIALVVPTLPKATIAFAFRYREKMFIWTGHRIAIIRHYGACAYTGIVVVVIALIFAERLLAKVVTHRLSIGEGLQHIITLKHIIVTIRAVILRKI